LNNKKSEKKSEMETDEFKKAQSLALKGLKAYDEVSAAIKSRIEKGEMKVGALEPFLVFTEEPLSGISLNIDTNPKSAFINIHISVPTVSKKPRA